MALRRTVALLKASPAKELIPTHVGVRLDELMEVRTHRVQHCR